VTHGLAAGARVCSGSESLEASSRAPQLEAEITQLKEAFRQRQQIGIAPGLLVHRFLITPERSYTLAANKADDENDGVATSKLRIVKDSHERLSVA
jgi:hypothetical protein